MTTDEILDLFDEHLAKKGLRLDAVVIAHPDWPKHVRSTLANLGRRLGHDV